MFSDRAGDSLQEKADTCQRFSKDELHYIAEKDFLQSGLLARAFRLHRHGRRTFYTVNLHLHVSNVCQGTCRFCGFRKEPGQPGAFTLSPEEVLKAAEERMTPQTREIHLVSAVTPQWGLGGYEWLFSQWRERFPKVFRKGLTAVEVNALAQRENCAVERVLEKLKAAGLESLTGGGAEVFSPRVRQQLCPDKLPAEGWLAIHEAAHRLKIASTATLLFGHIETWEERLDHLLQLRELQDSTGGFTDFVPLAFQPENTPLEEWPAPSATDCLKMVALARLTLDNFPHIRIFTPNFGAKLAQTALAWGADDLGGTVGEEAIQPAQVAADLLSPEKMDRLIREAQYEPVERDGDEDLLPKPSPPLPFNPRLEDRLRQAAEGRDRLEIGEALRLWEETPLPVLAQAALTMRNRLHSPHRVTYTVDRNINWTNRCVSRCLFCAFARDLEDPESWRLSRAELAQKIEELAAIARPQNIPPQILFQGGLDPTLKIEDYEALFTWMKEQWPDLRIHGLSPPEIHYLSQKAELPWSVTLRRLGDAGLSSLPGGGAEILVPAIRKKLSPNRCDVADWIGVCRSAHQLGIPSSATLVLGLGETMEDRLEHLARLRNLQEETGGFTAFIPWTFQPDNTPLQRQTEAEHKKFLGAGGAVYLRFLALARLFLDNIPHVQASWVTQGASIAQLALPFGADDLGSTMVEENVVAAAGARFRLSPVQMEQLAAQLGYQVTLRDYHYRLYPGE